MAGVSDPVGQWPDRRPPAPGEPIRILFGRPRFTADHAWEDIPLAWDGKAEALADRVVIEHVGDNELDARLTDDAAPVHVVVPIMSPVTGAVIERGAFGLVQQFGAGVDLIDLAAAARCGVYVANMPGLNAVPVAEHATARENVADGLLYAGVPAAERYARADEALERVGLSDRATFKPTKLSGGERQRVAIARALVGRPAIVLADEPTGNLDSTTGASIMELIGELNAAGATIILITHDGDLADRLPRQIRMLDGQVVSDRCA